MKSGTRRRSGFRSTLDGIADGHEDPSRFLTFVDHSLVSDNLGDVGIFSNHFPSLFLSLIFEHFSGLTLVKTAAGCDNLHGLGGVTDLVPGLKLIKKVKSDSDKHMQNEKNRHWGMITKTHTCLCAGIDRNFTSLRTFIELVSVCHDLGCIWTLVQEFPLIRCTVIFEHLAANSPGATLIDISTRCDNVDSLGIIVQLDPT
jgi:hypothetical protein